MHHYTITLTSILIGGLLVFVHQVNAELSATEGTVRLYRNGVPDYNQSWSSGIVQIYYDDKWGNICDDSSFGMDEANVICNQLGYNGVKSYTTVEDEDEYGVDNAPTVLEEVTCFDSSYLTVTQCEFEDSSKNLEGCEDADDVIVTCETDRIWEASPYTNDIRLTGGTYSNQGLLEVYCNGQWGTVCGENFDFVQATVACSTLGYNGYEDFNHLLNLTGSGSIWLNSNGRGCSFTSSCFYTCQACTSNEVIDCDHSKDVTLECKYIPTSTKNTNTNGSCADELAAAIAAAIVVVVVIILCCCCAIACAIGIPICICCCIGVGVGAITTSSKKKPPKVTFADSAPPPSSAPPQPTFIQPQPSGVLGQPANQPQPSALAQYPTTGGYVPIDEPPVLDESSQPYSTTLYPALADPPSGYKNELVNV